VAPPQAFEPAAPAASPKTPVIAPKKEIVWKLPKGPLTEVEKPLVGTWAASVGDFATRTAFMSGFVAFNLQGGKGLEGIVEAIKKDDRLKTSCIWLELFEDRKGVRRECAIFNGEPSALDLSNPLTGEKKDSGVKLEWYFDAAAKVVRVRYEGDMLVPSVDQKTQEMRDLRFRHWVLKLGKQVGDGIEVQESIPEHDYDLPSRYVYQIFPGSFLADKK
jgi:hypothetical protein